MTLLELVNGLRDLLRENAATTVLGSGPDLRVQVGLVNRAARKVFARRAWTFLARDDGYAFFPASLAATVFPVDLSPTVGTIIADVDRKRFSDGFVSSKILFTTNSTFVATSYRIADWLFDFVVSSLTLATPFHGAGVTSTATIYANEVVLPETVGRVLSVRNEENAPLRFETVDSFDDFDRMFPLDTERFSSPVEVVAVGGQAIATTRNGAVTPSTATAGLGMRIFPPSNANTLLRYSYVARLPELAMDTDEFAGVPVEVQDHIVDWAFYMALFSNIEDDSTRARQMRIDLEVDYRALCESDRRDVGRRHVPRPFGSYVGSPYWRFGQIPEP